MLDRIMGTRLSSSSATERATAVEAAQGAAKEKYREEEARLRAEIASAERACQHEIDAARDRAESTRLRLADELAAWFFAALAPLLTAWRDRDRRAGDAAPIRDLLAELTRRCSQQLGGSPRREFFAEMVVAVLYPDSSPNIHAYLATRDYAAHTDIALAMPALERATGPLTFNEALIALEQTIERHLQHDTRCHIPHRHSREHEDTCRRAEVSRKHVIEHDHGLALQAFDAELDRRQHEGDVKRDRARVSILSRIFGKLGGPTRIVYDGDGAHIVPTHGDRFPRRTVLEESVSPQDLERMVDRELSEPSPDDAGEHEHERASVEEDNAEAPASLDPYAAGGDRGR